MIPDPYAPHLRQADDLFAKGEIVKAGQIWQAILKQQPGHAGARERLLAVKQQLVALRNAEAAAMPPATLLEPEPVPVLEPVSAPEPESPSPVPATHPPVATPGPYVTGALDPERLLAEGCTLYDMGQLEDALLKWEQVLVLEPAHALARGYANGARRELGMAPLPAPEAQAPAAAVVHHGDEDIDKLLREAVQLYDMGLIEEAISKWERVLMLEPDRPEIAGYLRQARSEVHESPSAAAPAPAVLASVVSESEALDLKLRQAEHLLTLQRHEEAAFTFQQALGLDPGNAQALHGLERCRKPGGRPTAGAPSQPVQPTPALTLDSQGRITMAAEEPRPLGDPNPQGVEPPATLLQAAPAPRTGLSVPERFRKATERMPWLKDPKLLAGIGGGILVLAVGLGILHSYTKDQALKEDVRAARSAAMAPVAQQAQAPDLSESPASIREEAEATLVTDPLRAYLRAEALVGRNASDTAAAQLLEKARAGLAGGVTGATRPEFQKHMQNGDLEAALRVMDALLRAEPADADLRARAARLHLALCTAHAAQGKWEEAHEDLLRGRALFPGDKAWQSRLQLLERVKTMPKNQQASWIALLG